jgi:uncharacterized caspase-like protein
MLHAVLVGIDKYSDPSIGSLSYARADAEALGHLINEGIHPAERQVRLLLDNEATKRNIMVAVGEDLPRLASPDDIILIFFAGHGSPETGGSPDEVSRYLIAHDTEYDNIYATGIDMEREFPRWYQRVHDPKLVLLFIDACFSGRAGGRTFQGPRLSRARAEHRGRPLSLRTLDLGEGRLMLSACDDDQVARESREFQHGVFTHYLLRALSTPSVDEETISVHALYVEVLKEVTAYSSGRQLPVFNGRDVGARFPRLA